MHCISPGGCSSAEILARPNWCPRYAWKRKTEMRNSFIAISRCLLVAGCLVGLIASHAACSRQQPYAAPPTDGDAIVIQISALPLDVPQFYFYRAKGKDVNFFVLRMQNRVLSFLDACLTCYPRKLGYASKEGYVVCRACDTTYSVHKLEKGIGGCYPIRLEGRQEGSSYFIARSTLERHAGKF
jgi:uncharacterized membrane protein